jgi:hypothetical protein
MATLRYYNCFEVANPDGEAVKGGSRSAPIEIDCDGLVSDEWKSLATATTWDAWITGTEEGLTQFDFFWMYADQAVRIELTVDKGAEVGTEEIAILWPAETPFTLVGDDALALYTTDFAAGTADVIDRIRIRNESGSTAKIRRVLVT